MHFILCYWKFKKKKLNFQAKSIEFFPINWPRNIWYVKDKLKINDNLTV